MELTRTTLLDLTTGYNTIFNRGFERAAPQYTQVAMDTQSTGRKTGYPFLGNNTGFREWVGGRVFQNLEKHGFAITNKRFENTQTVDVDDVEDDTYGEYNPMMENLGESARTHPDELIFSLMRHANEIVGYDGQPFLDLDHPVKTVGGSEYSVSNFSQGDGPLWYLLDVNKVVKSFIYQKRHDYRFVMKSKPDDEMVFHDNKIVFGANGRGNVGVGLWQLAAGSKQPLTPENYEAVRARMRKIRNDADRPMNVMPTLLVVGADYESIAKRIVQVTTEKGGGDNPNVNTAKLLVTPWLD